MTDLVDLADRWGLGEDRFWLRGHRPEHLVEFDEQMGLWHVYGYPEAVEVLSRDSEFSTNSSQLFELDAETAKYIEGDLTQMAGPEHAHLRGQVAEAFTGEAMRRLGARIAAETDELLDRLGDPTRFDLLGDFVCELSGTMFGELLGIPASDRGMFDLITATMDVEAQLTTGEQHAGGTEDYFEGLTTPLQPLRDMLGRHIDDRLDQPRTDLLSLLAGVRKLDGEKMTRDQIINFVIGILGAGHISTPMLIGNTVLCLDAFPDQADRIRRDRSLIGSLFEETMRFLTPANASYRATTAPVVLAGRAIGENQLVRVWFGAANRDPREFTDPDSFDAGRDPNRHLGFGFGNHFCLGHRMIEVESGIVLNRLLDRFPSLAVDPEAAPVFYRSPDFTGVKALVVTTGDRTGQPSSK